MTPLRRYAQKFTHFNMNSGLFYLRANPRTISLMKRLEYRLSHEKYWDQTAYNEELFRLAHGDYSSPQVALGGGFAGWGWGRGGETLHMGRVRCNSWRRCVRHKRPAALHRGVSPPATLRSRRLPHAAPHAHTR